MAERIAIIGAGMAGLTCARALAASGRDVTVYDKGRGIGGRLSTRRTQDGLRFDHGAQYITARTPAFAQMLQDMAATGGAALWQHGTREDWVGAPGMSGLAKAMADGLTVHQSVEVTALRWTGAWFIETGGGAIACDRLILTVPAPQAAALLGADDPFAGDLARVSYAPCWTLMAAFPTASPRPFESRRDGGDDLAWIARDGSKPGRGDTNTWVAQASPGWSAEHLERSKDDIAPEMLGMLADRIGADAADATYAAAHRWRYAAVQDALGRPSLSDPTRRLHLGGDWCLDARVEAAWQSGRDIADE
ncbi:MAG: FAD-dependent oxidoreductase, partial [Pseudomonadota bacterium]